MSAPEITPSELRFRFQLGKSLAATINIHNPTDQRYGFKVKTTTPKKYVVRPSAGFLEPNQSISVQVLMQAQKEYPTDMANSKDKFLVQTAPVSPDQKEITPETFKASQGVKDAKLRVILEGPPAPPSPVPEETDEEKSDVQLNLPTTAAPAPPSTISSTGTVEAKLKSALDSLAAATLNNNNLQAQISALMRERDELKRKVEAAAYHSGGGVGVTSTGTKKVAVLPSRLAILHLILVAIIAFLIGHFTR